ncbi:MAG: flagellar biosynthetic protein FliQ [Pseudomonadota bacterium]
MSDQEVYTAFSSMVWAVLIGSGPVLGVALVVGLAIAFVQALTQIQEMTLTFVPKIVAIFVGLIASAPFMYATLARLSTNVFDRIGSGAF